MPCLLFENIDTCTCHAWHIYVLRTLSGLIPQSSTGRCTHFSWFRHAHCDATTRGLALSCPMQGSREEPPPCPASVLPLPSLPVPSHSSHSAVSPSVSLPAPLVLQAPILFVKADPGYMKALEAWRVAKRVTSHGPSPPPKADLRTGTAEEQERRLAAYTEAKLQWDALKAEWDAANAARKKKQRAERDAPRPRPSAERQQRSVEAQQRRVALKLRSAAQQKQFPLVTPATFLEFSAPGANKHRLWKRLTGERLPSQPMFWDVWKWDDECGRQLPSGEFKVLNRTPWFFVFMTDRDANDVSWKGASLGFYLPTNFEGESSDGQPINMRLTVGQHKPIAWEGEKRDLPFYSNKKIPSPQKWPARRQGGKL